MAGVGIGAAVPVFLSNLLLGAITLGTSISIGLLVIYQARLKKTWKRITSHARQADKTVQIFFQRSEATPHMLFEMKTHKKIVFIGLSQSNLDHYLKDVLDDNKVLPWESIQIFFCNDDVGRSWEGEQFRANLRRSRRLIATLLTARGRRSQLPNLKRISFRQCKQPLMYGGSMFSGSERMPESATNHDVIYVVQYLPANAPDSKKALTWKIRYDNNDSFDSEGRKLLERYEAAFEIIERDSHNLGDFTPSIWDRSATEWTTFL